MFDLDRWQEIWISITHNKTRSTLTAFGVFWGMFMLVVMVGAGVALRDGMNAEVKGFATNSCFIFARSTSLPYKGFQKDRNWSIVNEDIPVILSKVPEIQYLSPNIIIGGIQTNRGDKYGSYDIKGYYPVQNFVEESELIYGRYVNDIDIKEKRKVCILGERVYEVLFGKNENPIGKNIQINGIYFKVVGVSKRTGDTKIGPSDETSIIIPFNTVQQAFNQGNIIHFIGVTAKPGVKASYIEEKIKEVLRMQHDISPDDLKAVASFNFEEIFTKFLYLGIGVAVLIWIVGMGTLLAGGIGISNIMLVTIRERTKEIGIRRALGATPWNIASQILSESIILTLIAGITGLMIGVGLLQLVCLALRQSDQFFKEPQISFGVAVISLIILLVIGVLAGLIPVRRALSIKPIEAIREE